MAATAIAKSSSGPARRHVLASHGSSSYPFDFYSTTYSTQHGGVKSPHTTKTFRHKGTGYSANFRPAVYYDRKTDLMEYPTIANLLSDNYGTSSLNDYRSQPLNTGYEQLPSSIRQGPSGYTHNLPITRELYKHRASSNTIYRGEYPLKQFRDGAVKHSERSNKEVSGFTHSVNVEPITYRPTECHSGDLPGTVTWRPTGHTIMKEDFRTTPLLSGHESLPMATERANQSNGYIKGHSYPAIAQPVDIKGPFLQDLHHQVAYTKRKCDPALFSTITHPHQYTAFKSIIYTPQGIHPYTNTTATNGRQEPSGYSDNTIPHFNNIQPAYYNTSTGDNFSSPPIPQLPPPTDSSTARPILSDGFTKSTRVHSYRPQYNPTQTLRNQHPYVAKSILVHDPCFVDLTYRNKKRLSK